jgi:uncharacterized protein (DUF2062 family)
MMSRYSKSIREKAAGWLRQGISPRRLALTLALGFAIGCIPVLGATTAVCLAVALALRLNLPIIQAANWAAMPLQVALIVPFVRLGRRLFPAAPALDAASLLHNSWLSMVWQLGWFTAHALAAWLLIAVPAVLLMTAALTVLLRRVPALAAAQAGN